MEIKEKEIDKLSQLDRIEYKQSCNEYKIGFDNNFNFIFLVLILSFCFALVGLLEVRLTNFCLSIAFVMVILGNVCFSLIGLSFIKKQKELDQKYFKINLKDKKK